MWEVADFKSGNFHGVCPIYKPGDNECGTFLMCRHGSGNPFSVPGSRIGLLCAPIRFYNG